MRPDAVERLGNSVVQHGPANDRVYLMKLDRDDLPGIVGMMEDLGRRHGYSKLFARVPGRAVPQFKALGFAGEARVPGMCRGRSDGWFMAKYMAGERAKVGNRRRIDDILGLAQGASAKEAKPAPGVVVRLEARHCEALAGLYASVFNTYPFPIDDPAWLRTAMESEVFFFGMFDGEGRLSAAASSEVDRSWRCAEMTDFATRPAWRGRGAAGNLLARMEREMGDEGVVTAYTIARAQSPGMNIVFARAGYEHGGILPNNTQIAGRLESMNVWYKSLVGPVFPA